MTTILVVQAIATVWSKAARGAPLAAERRRVPSAVPLPPITPLRDGMIRVVHQVTYRESNGFREPSHERINAQPFGGSFAWCDDNLLIDVRDGHVHVDYQWRRGVPWRSAAPWRRPTRDLVIVDPGEIGRVVFNYRASTDDGEWYYVQWTVHLALVEDFAPRLFLDRPPDHHFRDLVRLR